MKRAPSMRCGVDGRIGSKARSVGRGSSALAVHGSPSQRRTDRQHLHGTRSPGWRRASAARSIDAWGLTCWLPGRVAAAEEQALPVPAPSSVGAGLAVASLARERATTNASIVSGVHLAGRSRSAAGRASTRPPRGRPPSVTACRYRYVLMMGAGARVVDEAFAPSVVVVGLGWRRPRSRSRQHLLLARDAPDQKRAAAPPPGRPPARSHPCVRQYSRPHLAGAPTEPGRHAWEAAESR